MVNGKNKELTCGLEGQMVLIFTGYQCFHFPAIGLFTHPTGARPLTRA
jgi:hypothetical protein